jgi:hypothetical protein
VSVDVVECRDPTDSAEAANGRGAGIDDSNPQLIDPSSPAIKPLNISCDDPHHIHLHCRLE